MPLSSDKEKRSGPQRRITVSKYGESFYEVKKSRFIGYCKPVLTPDEANSFVEEIRKKHSDARHNVYAWILKKETGLQKYSDDGEPSGTAGLPVMSVLTKNGVTDCAIVVTRYFGGILLGKGGLVRAYTRAAASALKEAVPKVMEMCAHIELKVPYPMYDKLVFEMKGKGYHIADTTYGEDIRLKLYIPLDREEEFTEFVRDTSMGTVTPVRLGEIEADTEEISIVTDEEDDEDDFS